MEVVVESGNIEVKDYELLAVNLFEKEGLSETIKFIDRALDGLITRLIEAQEFQGRLNQTNLIHTMGKLKIKRVLMVGLGEKKEFNLEVVRIASGKVAQIVRELGLESYAQLFLEGTEFDADIIAQSVLEGSELALYRFDQYKTEKDERAKLVKKLIIYTPNEGLVPKIYEGVKVGGIIVEGVKLARDLANMPSNIGTPTFLAEKAIEVAKDCGLKCQILEREDMERLGMGGILNVSRGSDQPPKFIILEYNPLNDRVSPIVLIGKAITFDSGGISIKPSERMDEMKYDKSGGSAVIAIMQTVAKLKLPLRVIGIIPATENLPSGKAYKPGDIIKIYGGKTVEVINTDAEGRLILADAISYATQYKPEAIIDLATLTGACVIALGTLTCGMMGNDQRLKKGLMEAAKLSGEMVWELPLWKEYGEFIKSEVADMKNVGGRAAGAIIGAIFLSKFVENYPWVHLDIAGTAYTQEGSLEKTYIPKGATGFGVRLITQLLRNWKNL
ncbi:MAG: leucyl aminopeptidase [Nitrososphaerales archaeon]|nr:leucyl aminopeptidase [Nitrososphaerales archaeon]